MQEDELARVAGASSGPPYRYIVQVWKEAPEAPWRGVLRDTETGRVRPFRDVDEILAFLGGEESVLDGLLQDEWPGWTGEREGEVMVEQDQLLDTPVVEVFAQATIYPKLAAVTLLEATTLPEGAGVSGAASALLRAAAAAILCASHPDLVCSRSHDEIVREVDAALASGDVEAMLELAGQITSDL